MISVDFEAGRFNYRVAALILCGRKILLHIQNENKYWTLPGGRCEFGETGKEAVLRELKEETGHDFEV